MSCEPSDNGYCEYFWRSITFIDGSSISASYDDGETRQLIYEFAEDDTIHVKLLEEAWSNRHSEWSLEISGIGTASPLLTIIDGHSTGDVIAIFSRVP
jgi:hypothetical protein